MRDAYQRAKSRLDMKKEKERKDGRQGLGLDKLHRQSSKFKISRFGLVTVSAAVCRHTNYVKRAVLCHLSESRCTCNVLRLRYGSFQGNKYRYRIDVPRKSEQNFSFQCNSHSRRLGRRSMTSIIASFMEVTEDRHKLEAGAVTIAQHTPIVTYYESESLRKA